MDPLPVSCSVTLMFRELPVTQRFTAAAAARFDGVEIQLLDEASPAELVAAARAAALPVILVNVGMGDFLAGGPGLSGVPGREAEFIAEFAKTLALARQLGSRYIHVGPSRVPAGGDPVECLQTLKTNVLAASALLQRETMRLLVEPLNRADVPDVLLADVDEAGRWMRDEINGAAHMMFDIYHVARSGKGIVDAFRRNRDLVKHVQFSDVPGRRTPGTGQLGFPGLLREMQGAGYDGWLGAEYLPDGPTAQTLDWLDRYRSMPAAVDRSV
jgi:hydroxypyruvate isomerase